MSPQSVLLLVPPRLLVLELDASVAGGLQAPPLLPTQPPVLLAVLGLLLVGAPAPPPPSTAWARSCVRVCACASVWVWGQSWRQGWLRFVAAAAWSTTPALAPALAPAPLGGTHAQPCLPAARRGRGCVGAVQRERRLDDVAEFHPRAVAEFVARRVRFAFFDLPNEKTNAS